MASILSTTHTLCLNFKSKLETFDTFMSPPLNDINLRFSLEAVKIYTYEYTGTRSDDYI